MINSQVVALGTTPCWAGCIYDLNPEIALIEAINQDYFEEKDNDNS